MQSQFVLTAATPRKRGFTRFAVGFFGMYAVGGLLVVSLSGWGQVFSGKFNGIIPALFGMAVLGGLGYSYYKAVLKGTTLSKQLLGMKVLKYDPQIKAYRACTPKEILIHEACATFYFPVSFAIMAGPAVALGALAGGLTSGSRAVTDRTKLDEMITEHKSQAAAAAGAAVGAGISLAILQKFPHLLAPHNKFLSTIVVNVDKEKTSFFEQQGTWDPGGKIVNMYAENIEVEPQQHTKQAA